MTIRPGIVTSTGETIYPTGDEWILAFAIKGCQWAIDIVETWDRGGIGGDLDTPIVHGEGEGI
jgi:hypothetical protein